MVQRESDGIWITLKEEIHAAPGEVAACVADAAGLCRWLAVAAEYPPEAGATLSIAWDRTWAHSTDVRILLYECIRAHDGFARVRWEWYPSTIDVSADERPVPVELSVTPLPDRGGDSGGARVILRHGPFGEDPETLLVVADSAESWRWYLCNLRSVLEQKHDMRAVRPL